MCSLFFERFVLFFCLKIERFVPDSAEIWICGLYKQYVSEVENAYNSSFPQNVEVLTNYLPLQVYNQIFLKVRSMVMSAWRQESIGTIIMGLYLGIKVFMSERSPLYKWFVDCGFNIFAIETAKGEDLDTPLSTKDKQRNRELVLERYNEERIARSLKENIVD